MSGLQFLDSCLKLGLSGTRTLLLCLPLFLRRFQFVLQPGLRLLVLRQLSFQLIALLANLPGTLLGAFPAPCLFGQRFRQLLDMLLQLRLLRLQFLGLCLQSGLFGAGSFLECLQLFFRCFQFLPQMSELSFQFVPPLIGLARLLLGAFSALGFFSQCFCQSLDSLHNACLDSLKLRGPCHQQ